MNQYEILSEIQKAEKIVRDLRQELNNLRREEYAKEILILKGKCYKRKDSFDSESKCLYKIIDCSPNYTSSDLQIVSVTSFSENNYSIERTAYSGRWFEDNDFEEISSEDFIKVYKIIFQKINTLKL